MDVENWHARSSSHSSSRQAARITPSQTNPTMGVARTVEATGFVAGFACVVVVLLVGGCRVGPDYQRPDTPTTAAWREGDIVVRSSWQLDTNWWTLFDDDALTELELAAVANNQDLRQAVARVDESRASLRAAKADRYPAVDLSASAERSRSPSNSRTLAALLRGSGSTGDDFSISLDASYEVDLWGKVRRSVEAAEAWLSAEAAARDTVLLTLTADVALNYFNLRQLDAELDVLQRAVALRSRILEITRRRLDGGIGNEADVSSAETELARAESEAIDVRRRRSLVEHALAVLCGKAPASFRIELQTAGQISPPEILAGLPSELLTRRPDVAEAERRAAAQCASVGVAKAAFLPSITLTGAGGFESVELKDLFAWESRAWSFGPSVSLPIFQGGRNRANLQVAEARYEQAVAEYRQRVLGAFQDVEDALVNVRRHAERADVLARAEDSARRTANSYDKGLRGGIFNFLNVVDSQRQWLQAEIAVAQNTGERHAACIQLVKALGGGWTSPDAEEEPSTPEVEE